MYWTKNLLSNSTRSSIIVAIKMELKPPKKKRSHLELKSALPLIFDGKGKLTTFHANLSALGTCIVDPTEMEMIYTMVSIT